MKVDKIVIKNYKGFENCEVNFHPNVNVFIGSNASGKTTMLNAISKSATAIVPRVTNNNQMSSINIEDINYNSLFSYIVGDVSGFTDENINFKSFTHAGIVTEEAKLISSEINDKIHKIANIFNARISVSPTTIPIIKFYPANRSSFTYSEVSINNIFKISQLETWSNIRQSSLSYSKFFHWFFENETDELRLQRDYKDFNAQSPALRDVRKALRLTFEELGYGNFTLISKQIKRKGNSKLLPSIFLKNLDTKKEESLDNKSDGEKAIITLIADIAYNLSIAKDFSIDDDFLKSPGIVLIDEIETHLHPKWQREILPILTKLFPNIQFFVATHSPQIVASVNSESVFVFDNFNVDKVNLKTLGEDTNSLLRYIFEATDRPKSYIDLIEKIETLMDQDATSSAIKKIISEIEKKYNQDTASSISNLIDELNIRLSAYEFDKKYEKDR